MSRFLQSDNTIDVLSKATKASYEEFFGPTDGSIPLVTESRNLADILVELGLIESKSWARKNGWFREVSPGFQEIVFGKSRVKIYLFLSERPNEEVP